MRRFPEPSFESCYMPEPMSGCWLWLRGHSGDGYGAWKGLRAHRASYERHVAPLPRHPRRQHGGQGPQGTLAARRPEEEGRVMPSLSALLWLIIVAALVLAAWGIYQGLRADDPADPYRGPGDEP